MSKHNLRTGEVANLAGVSIATLRYYERRGLIPPPSRTASGYRAFGTETVRTVRMIKAAQALGFTLKEIHSLLSVVLAPDGAPADLYAIARAKADELNRQARSIEQKRSALSSLLADCNGDDAAIAAESHFVRGLEASASLVDDPQL